MTVWHPVYDTPFHYGYDTPFHHGYDTPFHYEYDAPFYYAYDALFHYGYDALFHYAYDTMCMTLCIWHPIPLCVWHRSTMHMTPCSTIHMTPRSTKGMTPHSTMDMYDSPFHWRSDSLFHYGYDVWFHYGYDAPFHYGYDALFHYAWGFIGYSSQGMDPLQMPFLEIFPIELLDIVADLCYIIFCNFFVYFSFFLSLENVWKWPGTNFQTQRIPCMVEFKVLTYISANQQMGWCLKAPTTHRWALHWGTYFSQWRGTNLPTTHRRNFIHRISHFAFATMVLGNVCALYLVTGCQVAAQICDVYSAVTETSKCGS